MTEESKNNSMSFFARAVAGVANVATTFRVKAESAQPSQKDEHADQANYGIGASPISIPKKET